MTHNHTFTTLRALKGTPITILLTLYLRHAPASQRWLSMTLGYDRKTIRKTLGFLEQDGYVERLGHDEWCLSAGHLPLPDAEWLAPGLPAPDPPALPIEEDEQLEATSPVDGPRWGSSPHFPTTTTVTATSTNTKKVVAEKEAAAARGETPPPPSDPDPHVIAALAGFGVGEPMRSHLAALPHVELEYVRAHIAKARQEGPRTKPGLLIHRIQCADPMPEICDQCAGVEGDHAPDCSLHPDNDRRSYTTGKYADLIEH
jgi:hypothetical protein